MDRYVENAYILNLTITTTVLDEPVNVNALSFLIRFQFPYHIFLYIRETKILDRSDRGFHVRIFP